MTKTLNQIIFFYLHQNQNIFLEKTSLTPLYFIEVLVPSPEDEQRKHKLIITDIQEKDSGVYSCECGTTKTRCVLKVKGCIIYLF
jgi:hypothetical protein